MSKERINASMWMNEAAPETSLRKWFGLDPARFEEFRQRYLEELSGKPEIVAGLLELAQMDQLTLLYAARDPECNHPVVLRDGLLSRALQGYE